MAIEGIVDEVGPFAAAVAECTCQAWGGSVVDRAALVPCGVDWFALLEVVAVVIHFEGRVGQVFPPYHGYHHHSA